jgi:hypothetical protein
VAIILLKKGLALRAAALLLLSFAVATRFIALVIFLVLSMLRIRPLISCKDAI